MLYHFGVNTGDCEWYFGPEPSFQKESFLFDWHRQKYKCHFGFGVKKKFKCLHLSIYCILKI